MNVERSFGPDDVVGASHLLFGRHLRHNTLLNLLSRPAAGLESFFLGFGGARDADHGVELGFGFRLKQERNSHRSQWSVSFSPLVHLREPESANTRVEDSFQLLASSRVGKNFLGE